MTEKENPVYASLPSDLEVRFLEEMMAGAFDAGPAEVDEAAYAAYAEEVPTANMWTPEAAEDADLQDAADTATPPVAAPLTQNASAGAGAPVPFDVATAPLLVPTLLEASAGTGKTFSIMHLVLRLVVEANMPVRELLVVTFTKAATAELAGRIRAHLEEACAYIAGERSEGEINGLIVQQAQMWRETLVDEVILERLKGSLLSFDDASIFTIHGFCQKTLRNHAFTAGGSAEHSDTGDDEEARRDVVEDFLRRALDRLQTEEERRELMSITDWQKFLRLLASAPEDLLPRICMQDEASDTVFAELERFVKEAPERLRGEKARLRLGTYDDMLVDMWRAIRNDASGGFVRALRETYRGVLIDEFQDTDPLQFAIFERLFLRGLEGARDRALFFVGDPKQAIYSFRSADLNTYLRAREIMARVGRIAALTLNFRSTTRLVEAVNAFFNRGRGADGVFMRDGLDYNDVGAGAKKPGLWIRDEEGIWSESVPFEIWGTLLEEGFETAEDMQNAAAEAVASDIARLAALGRERRAVLPWNAEKDAGVPLLELEINGRSVPMRAVEARDFAVLVRKHKFVARIREALSARGVRMRVSSQLDVCATPEALELLLVLYAAASPGEERAVRPARATRFMGETLSEIVSEADAPRVRARERLERARALWTGAGVGAALGYLARETGLAERLLPQKGGERALANFMQLIEVLHAEGRSRRLPAGLIAWFERQIADPQRSPTDERLQRTESEGNVVTAVTIHSSKGLEYPIVYVPFVELEGPPADKRSDFRYWSAALGRTVLELHPGAASAPEAWKREQLEESSRLYYVALTRASARLVVTMPQKKTKSGWHGSYTKCCFLQMMTGLPKAGPAEARKRLEGLGALDPTAPRGILWREIRPLVEPPVGRPAEVAAPFAGCVDPAEDRFAAWRTSSFTGIARLVSDDEAPRPRQGKIIPGDDILTFPRGTVPGLVLHRVMELADFARCAQSDAEAERVKIVRSVLETSLRLAPEEQSVVERAVSRMMKDLLNAELLPGLRLRDVDPAMRMAEMEFTLSLPATLTAAELGQALETLDAGYAVPGLTDANLKGYLNGVIDLAFMAQGRFWVLDWKSNAIGAKLEEFTDEAVASEMMRHHYRLQYLLYWVALRRHIRARLGRWDDAWMGGALYIFMRAVRDDGPACPWGRRGVFYDPIDPLVIETLDRLFEYGPDRKLLQTSAQTLAQRRTTR